MKAYLVSSDIIDWQTPEVLAQAQKLSTGQPDALSVARACFEFVRDEVEHSWDFQRNPVTCKASDVLKYRTGYCYAKSHLLAALLRANNLPAGLCYQRLSINDETPPFCLHGLNAVFLEEFGWYRIDARGNKTGVDAQFCPPQEKLAFPIRLEGEADLPEIYAEPLPEVIETLTRCRTYLEVAENLPDIDLDNFPL